MIEGCNHPLSNGRTCVHVKAASVIRYEHCPFRDSYGPYGDAQCWHPHPLRKLHRHSHSWQLADAKRVDIDGREIDMETGEIGGYTDFGTGDIIDGIKTLHQRGTLADARRVLRLYGWGSTRRYQRCHNSRREGAGGYDIGRLALSRRFRLGLRPGPGRAQLRAITGREAKADLLGQPTAGSDGLRSSLRSDKGKPEVRNPGGDGAKLG